jgi:sugar phosphate isomerase/epimerase
MKIGAMNHPARDVISEIRWMAEMKLDFIDLTLEPPAACTGVIDVAAVKRALDDSGLGIVGHTAYYLPFCSPFKALRRGATEEFKRCIEIFGELGSKWVNVHPDRHAPFHDRAFMIEMNLECFTQVMPSAKAAGVGIMIENLPGHYNTPAEVGWFLDRMPELGMHLDIGHANLMVERNTTPDLCAAYGKRLAHVHAHDNKGGSGDLHLPIGAGHIDWPSMIRALKGANYNDTITLEVFSEDRHFLAYSRDRLRVLWDETVSA